jgi:hypothetical protein
MQAAYGILNVTSSPEENDTFFDGIDVVTIIGSRSYRRFFGRSGK